MKIRTIITLLVALVAFSFASSTSIALTHGGYPSDHFNTQVSITPSISITSGGTSVGSGSVCTGSTVQITPSITSNWGSGSIDIQASYPDPIYPDCFPGFSCPINMTADSHFISNQPINWLTSSQYSALVPNPIGTQYIGTDTTGGISTYESLGSFVNEPVTYSTSIGTNSNEQAGVNVFCSGTLQITQDGAVIGSYQLPLTGSVTATTATISSGSHTFGAQLSGVQCFGAVVDQPTYTSSTTDSNGIDESTYFRINYFSSQSVTDSDSFSAAPIVVSTSSPGTCSINSARVTVIAQTGESSLVHIQVTNTGSTSQITGISTEPSESGEYTTGPLDVSACASIFGSGLCPASNGFDTNIATGSVANLYAIVTGIAGRSGGYPTTPATLTLTSQVSSSGTECMSSSSSTCYDSVTVPAVSTTTPTACVITSSDPTTPVSVGLGDIAHFQVECTNIDGMTIPCIGSSWSWGSGIRGNFENSTTTNTDAYAVPTSGSSGTINYATSGVSCSLPVTTTTSQYTCVFSPPSATVAVLGVQFYGLSCQEAGANLTIGSATYDIEPATVATHSFDSPTGTYVIGSAIGTGTLYGYANFPTSEPWIVGHEGTAGVTVASSTTPTSCTINPASVSPLGAGDFRSFSVSCFGPGGSSVPCQGSDWSWGGFSGFLVPGTASPSSVIAGPDNGDAVGSIGKLEYSIGPVTCDSEITVGSPIFQCSFDPPSASITAPNGQYFSVSCDGAVITGSQYSTDPSLNLVSVLSNESNSGLMLNGTGTGAGNLYGFEDLLGGGSVLGHRAVAPVTVTGSGPGGNTTGPSGPPGGGPTSPPGGPGTACMIQGEATGSTPLTLISGENQSITVGCGPTGTELCGGTVNWQGDAGLSITGSGQSVTVNPIGIGTGTITVQIGNDPSNTCSLGVAWGDYTCIDVS